jgi:hypothetical protein
MRHARRSGSRLARDATALGDAIMHFGLLLSSLPHVSTGHAEYAALLSNCSAIPDKHQLGASMRRQLRFWRDAWHCAWLFAFMPRG